MQKHGKKKRHETARVRGGNRLAGRVWQGGLKVRGKPIPEGDLWIAALARQHELPIVSRDEHFDVDEKVQRLGW